MASGTAHAAGETIDVRLQTIDGTPEWDADDAPGHDSGPNNQVIRTNDNLTYSVEVSSMGGTADNTTITLALPKGVQFNALPAYCTGPGSSLTPNPMPAPTTPVTATSWTSLPQQTLVCNVGQVTSGSTRTWDLVARVRPEVPNGTKLPGISASVTSDFVTTPQVSDPVKDIAVSGRAQFDLSKNNTAVTENSGYYYSDTRPCEQSSGNCRYFRFPQLISAPTGGKGLSPLANPITWTDDLSPAALFGSGVTSDPDYIASPNPAAAFGGRLLRCSFNDFQQPAPRLGNPLTAVRESGTTTCTQAGGPGTPVSVSVTNADTTAYTYPTQAPRPTGFVLPGGRAYVYSGTIDIEIPIDAATALGVTSNNTSTLNLRNTLTDFNPTDIGGRTNVPEPTANNYRTGSIVASSSGYMSKYFAGVPNAVGNTPAAEFNPGDSAVSEGPAGSTGRETGTGQLFAGGTAISMIELASRSTASGSNTFFVCDAWDNQRLQLTNITAAGNGLRGQIVPANGAPAWISGVRNQVSGTADPSTLSNLRIQYGTGPGGPGAASTCADADSPAGWFDDPSAVPGNDPALAADGIYSAVTRVRLNVTVPAPETAAQAWFSIGLRAKDSLASGTILPNWATAKVAAGESRTLAEMLTGSGPTQSTYSPDDNTGNNGDRLIVASAVGRLVKDVWDQASGAWTTTTVPQYAGGQTVKFRLRPTITSGITASVTRDVLVEDCLPAGENFMSASLAPSLVSAVSGAMPTGSQIACSSGETYVRWNLGQRPVNEAIDPITYDVRVGATVKPGTYTNAALITAEDDLSAATERDASAQIQVVQPKGVWIDKVALTPVSEVNRPGETTLDPLKWRVDMVNIEATAPTPKDVDIIDVLPRQGVDATRFTGTLEFVSAAVTSGSTAANPVEVLYTKSPAVNPDAWDASNDADSGVVWCDAAGSLVLGAGTDANCAATMAEVTGLRFRRPGTFESGALISVEITMLPKENQAGDVYDNKTAGRAEGLQLIVGPIHATETIIGSSIGDRVWLDSNGNGLQDTGETGVAGFTVRLTGTDSDGNAVSLSTTTDSQGNYLFDNLQSGTYRVTFDPASLGANREFTLQKVGTNRAIDSDGDVATGVTGDIVLPGAFVNRSIDQGIVPTGISIVKQVCASGTGCAVGDDAGWVESTSVFRGDDVSWRLTVANTGATALSKVTVTDPLVPGCARTFDALAAGEQQRFTCSSSDLTADIDPNTASVTATTPNGNTVSASDTASAHVYTGAIGDTVWYDVDGDGVQDAGEPGIANATVTITYLGDPATTADDRVFTTTTDADGRYLVEGLRGGNYRVDVGAIDPDFRATYDLDGASTPGTTAVTLGDGQRRLDVDFGYTVHFALGDKVWLDTNGDGVRDPGEPWVPDGTVVELWNATTNTMVSSTTTTSGVYGFTGLPAGDYRVAIPASALTGTLAGAVAAPNGTADPNDDEDDPASHNALPGPDGSIVTGAITLSATLSPAAGAQITGDEPKDGYTNPTLDLALLGAPSIHIEKEVCDKAKGGCASDAAVGTDGWVESVRVDFLADVTWRITVTNTGLQLLSSVAVGDELVATCRNGDVGALAPGASRSYSCSTNDVLVGFTNTATVTATGPTGVKVSDEDTASVSTPTPVPGIQLVKEVTIGDRSDDANTAPGLLAPVGAVATWTYEVSLPDGVNVPLANVSVTDDNGTPGVGDDDFSAVYMSGDTNDDALLNPGETWRFATPKGHELTVKAGQYTNVATALGTPVSPQNAASLAAQDPANIFGMAPGIGIVKQVCTHADGCSTDNDKNWDERATVPTGGSAWFRITVTNTGNMTLSSVRVADPQAPGCARELSSLSPGASLQYMCRVSEVRTGFTNVATAHGQPLDVNGKPAGDGVSAHDDASVRVAPKLPSTGSGEGRGLTLTGGALVCALGLWTLRRRIVPKR